MFAVYRKRSRSARARGLPRRCVANLDNLRAVPKALRERAGRLAPRRVDELKRALGYALGWTELTTL